MRIEILCAEELHCDLMRAKLQHALAGLNIDAEIVMVMDSATLAELPEKVFSGLVIDGRLVAAGGSHTVDDIKRLLALGNRMVH